MSHDIEPMDVDDFAEYTSVLKESSKTPNKFQYYNDFDNKENSYNANIADDKYKIASGDKTFDAFDDSCTNMKLRWSCTPGSSPAVNRSSYDSRDRLMNNSFGDDSNSTFTAEDFENSNAILSSHNYSSDVQGMDMSLDNSRVTIVGHTSSTNISLDTKNSTLLQDHSIEPNKVPNISLNSVEEVNKTQDVTSPLSISIGSDNQSNSKDYQGASSPILRGIKSVINMFRPSQSPITPSGTSPKCAKNLNKSIEKTTTAANRSNEITLTPDNKIERKNSVTNRTFDGETKKQDSLEFVTVFKEDFINDIQWNDDSTIIFNTKKLKGNAALQDGESHSLSSSSQLSTESHSMQSRGNSVSKVSLYETYDNSNHSIGNEISLKLQGKPISEETQNEMNNSIQNGSEKGDNLLKYTTAMAIVDNKSETINVDMVTQNKLLENISSQISSANTSQTIPTAALTENALTETFLRCENNVQDNVSKDFSESTSNVNGLDRSNLSQLLSPADCKREMTALSNDILKDEHRIQTVIEYKTESQSDELNIPSVSNIVAQQNLPIILEDNLKSSNISTVEKKDIIDRKSIIREENNSPIEEFEDCLEQLSEANGFELNFEAISAPESESIPVTSAEKCNDMLVQTIVQDLQMPITIQNVDNSDGYTIDTEQNIEKILINGHTDEKSKLPETAIYNSENTDVRRENHNLTSSHVFDKNYIVTTDCITDSFNANNNLNFAENKEQNSIMKVGEEENTNVNDSSQINIEELPADIAIELLTKKVGINLNASNVLETDNNASHTDNTAVNKATSIDLTEIKPDIQSNKIKIEIETELLCESSKNVSVDKAEVSTLPSPGDLLIENVTECANINYLANESINHNMNMKENMLSTERLIEDSIKIKNSIESQENIQIIAKTEINSIDVIHSNNFALGQCIPVEVEHKEVVSTLTNLNTDLDTNLPSNETLTLEIAKNKLEVDLGAQYLQENATKSPGDREIKITAGPEISHPEFSNEQMTNTLPVEININLSENTSCANDEALSDSQLDRTIDLNNKSDNELANVKMPIQMDQNISCLMQKNTELSCSQNGNFENIDNPFSTKTNIRLSPQPSSCNREYDFESTIDPFKTNVKLRLSPDPDDHYINSSLKEIRTLHSTSKTENGTKIDLSDNKMDIDEDLPDMLVSENNIIKTMCEFPSKEKPQPDFSSVDVAMEVSIDCRDATTISQNATTLSVSLDTVKSDLTGEMQSNRIHTSDVQECDEPVIFQPIKASTSNDLGNEMNINASPQIKTNDVFEENEDAEIKEIMQSNNLYSEENRNPFMTRTKISMSPNVEEKLHEYEEMSFEAIENPFTTRSKVTMSPTFEREKKPLTQITDKNMGNTDLTQVFIKKQPETNEIKQLESNEIKHQELNEKYAADQVSANTTSNSSIVKQSKSTSNKPKRPLIRKSQGNKNLSATPKKIVAPIVNVKNDEMFDFEAIENPFATRTSIRMSPTPNETQNKCIENLQNTNRVSSQTTTQLDTTHSSKMKQTQNQISEQMITVDSPSKTNTPLKVTPIKQKLGTDSPSKIKTPVKVTPIKQKLGSLPGEERSSKIHEDGNTFITQSKGKLSPSLENQQSGNITTETKIISTSQKISTDNDVKKTVLNETVSLNKMNETTTFDDGDIDMSNPFATRSKVRLSPTLENQQIHKLKIESEKNSTLPQPAGEINVKTISNVLNETMNLNIMNETKTFESSDIDTSNPFVTRSKVRLSPSLENQQIHKLKTESEIISTSPKSASDIDAKIISNVLNETVNLNVMNETKTIENSDIDISNPFATRSKVRLSPSLENQQIHKLKTESEIISASPKSASDIDAKIISNVLNETVSLNVINETKTIENSDDDISNPFATKSKVRLSPSLENQQIHKLKTESEIISTSPKSTSDIDAKMISNVLNETVSLNVMNETKTVESSDIKISNPFATKSKIQASPSLNVTITDSDKISMNSTIENGETTYIKKSDSVLEISQIVNKNEPKNAISKSEEKKDNNMNLTGEETFCKTSNETILNTAHQNESPKGSFGYIQQLVNQVSNIILPSHKLPASFNGSSMQNGQKQQTLDDVTVKQDENASLNGSSMQNGQKHSTTIKQDENDEEFAPAEMFFKDEAIDYLMNQTTITTDCGKDSLFIKFDPLYVASGKSNLEKIEAASTSAPAKNRLSGSFHEKPVLAVSPAVNSDQTKPIIQTPPRRESSTPRFVSPAIAAIDKLISLGGSPARGSPPAMLVDVRDTSSANYFQQQMETAKRLLSEREEEYKKKVSDLEKSNAEHTAHVKALEAKLLEQSKQNARMIKLNEEYEKTVLSLLSKRDDEKKKHDEEILRLVRERDEQTAHLSSMEHSFNDLHAKYEKCKAMILSFKSNEEVLKKRIADSEASCKKLEEVYEQIKKHATTKLNEANQTLETMKKAHKVETVKLNALIKRKELDISSLQETLTQKIKDNEALESICDELLIKVG